MSTHRWIVTGALVALLAGCEKAPAPPPETATAPVDTGAPAPAATTPVVEATPSAEPAAPAESSAPSAPTAEAAPSAVPTAAAESAAPHGAHPAKEHAAATPATPSPPASGGPTPDDPCQTKNFHYTQIASACRSGGRKAAKGVMKGVVKKAKAAGTDLQCTSCHEDTKDFHLKSNAVGDLKNWL